MQDKGLGTLMAMTLESVARQEGVKRVTCSAREDAVEFLPLGFANQGKSPPRKLRRFVTFDDQTHRHVGRYSPSRRLVRAAPAGMVSAHSAQ